MWQALTWYNENRCSPSWSERELRHKITSVANIQVKKQLGQAYGKKIMVKPVTGDELKKLSGKRPAAVRIVSPAQRMNAARVAALAELEANAMARLDAVYTAWRADPDKVNEPQHVQAYASAAIQAGLPFYGDDGADRSAPGWRQWGECEPDPGAAWRILPTSNP